MALKGLLNIPVTFSPNPVVGVSDAVLSKVMAPAAQSAMYAGAYVQIVAATITNSQCTVTAWFYDTDAKESILKMNDYSFPMDLDGPNNIKQGYEYLKTLAEFAGFVDVLEDGQTA